MVDVLIIVAVQDELTAVQQVLTRDFGVECREDRDSAGLPVWRATLPRPGHPALTLALACAPVMGGDATAHMVGRLGVTLKPGLLAMCGVCGGFGEKVALGDVVVASKEWEMHEGEWREMNTFRPPAHHLAALERFAQGWRSPPARPVSLATLGDRLLFQLEKITGEASFEDGGLAGLLPDRGERREVFNYLRQKNWMAVDSLDLTETGVKRARKIRTESGGVCEDPPFQVHVGAMATVDMVTKNAKIFNKLQKRERKTIALDMEAHAVGMAAWIDKIPGHLVVKGVQDLADDFKSDRFRTYAAEGAARFLLDYLKSHGGESIPPGGPKLTFPDELPHKDDTTFLLPESNAVPLLGRQQELAGLVGWCQGKARLSVRVVVGAGGTGKTRLAMVCCRELRPLGWESGFLEREDFAAFLAEPRWNHWFPDRDTLLVIDYAAYSEQEIQRWLATLTPPATGSSRLRLLLLERHASGEGGWFGAVFGGGLDNERKVAALLDPAAPVALSLLTDDRRTLLHAAVVAAGAGVAIPAEGEDAAFDQGLAQAAWWGHPLYLLMASLEMRDRRETKPVLRLKKPELAIKRAEREISRIQHFAAKPAMKKLLPHLAAQATLCAGLARGQMVTLVEQESKALGYSASPGEVADLLHTILPAPDEGVAPIRPDILAEAFILCALREGKTALPRTHALAPRLVMETLIRLLEDFPPATYPQPLAWLQALVEGSDLATLEGIAALFPHFSLPLLEVMAQAERRMVAMVREMGDDEETQAEKLGLHLNNLGNRLSDLGHREEALAATEEAVGHYRTLAAARPEAFLPDLAMSLNNLGNKLSDLGRREEALAMTGEAVGHYRTLAAARPEAFLPDLALSLNNLGSDLSSLGRREEALATTEEAVGHYRTLAAARPEAFLPDLAASLNNLGIRLSNLGRQEEALAATGEAVAHYRTLAAARPEAFLPNLAHSLGLTAAILNQGHQHGAALPLAEEAFATLLPFFRQYAAAFQPIMGSVVNDYNTALHGVGAGPPDELAEALAEVAGSLNGGSA